ncbi:hypothetical protein B0J14DRAFT_657503 [Halenospora varia]|nr:hypothetical protein B0J14DRAFT_657503 [Halenospora varia]
MTTFDFTVTLITRSSTLDSNQYLTKRLMLKRKFYDTQNRMLAKGRKRKCNKLNPSLTADIIAYTTKKLRTSDEFAGHNPTRRTITMCKGWFRRRYDSISGMVAAGEHPVIAGDITTLSQIRSFAILHEMIHCDPLREIDRRLVPAIGRVK